VNDKTNRPSAGAFKDWQMEISCDWSKYSTPQYSRELISKEYKHNSKEPKQMAEFFICSFKSEVVFNINQKIRHNPIQFLPIIKGKPNNKAHSLVLIDKKSKDKEKIDVKLRALLALQSKWEIFNQIECAALWSNHKSKNKIR
jgi:hypothetical protein